MDKFWKAYEDLLEGKGLTHDEFARSVGIDPGNWSRKRRGLTRLFKNDLDAMVRIYPELKLPIWQSIGANGDGNNDREPKTC